MPWKYRYLELPVLMLGAVGLAHCSSNNAPQGPACTSFTQQQDGSRVCATDANGANATGSGNGTTGIPMLDESAATGSSTTGIPMLDETAASSTTSTTSSGVTSTVSGTNNTSTAGSAVTAVTGVGGAATVTTDGAAVGTTGTASLGTLRVSAGSHARERTIVSFAYPDGAGKALSLTDMQGVTVPLQYSSATGKATFILDALAAGETKDYTINQLAQAMPAGVTATIEPDRTGDQLFLYLGTSRVFRWTLVEDNFRGALPQDVRAGYIYPVYTPAGLNVADDYQVDHPHMHGIWSAWTNTTFRGHKVDFWNGYSHTGRVDLMSMDGIWSGPVTAGLIANLLHSDVTSSEDFTKPGDPVLNEKWIVTVYKTHDGAPPFFVYDIDSTQVTASQDPLILETHSYGGFGFRGSEQWREAVSFLTSEGHNRSTGDGQRASWVAQYGPVDGQVAGYAAFDNPNNFRHPQGLRLHPSNPYWAFAACTASSGGRFVLEVGAPYHSVYRVVAFDGDPDTALLNRLYQDFAEPPTVELLP